MIWCWDSFRPKVTKVCGEDLVSCFRPACSLHKKTEVCSTFYKRKREMVCVIFSVDLASMQRDLKWEMALILPVLEIFALFHYSVHYCYRNWGCSVSTQSSDGGTGWNAKLVLQRAREDLPWPSLGNFNRSTHSYTANSHGLRNRPRSGHNLSPQVLSANNQNTLLATRLLKGAWSLLLGGGGSHGALWVAITRAFSGIWVHSSAVTQQHKFSQFTNYGPYRLENQFS